MTDYREHIVKSFDDESQKFTLELSFGQINIKNYYQRCKQ